MKKEFDLYIDESGDFGYEVGSSKYYIISLVFSDKQNDLSEYINVVDNKLKNYLTKNDYFHAGPLIRGENNFRNYTITERKKIFQSFFLFFSSLPIRCKSFALSKYPFNKDSLKLMGSLTKELYDFFITLKEKYGDLKINVYYDNGQIEVTKIFNSVFSLMPYEYELHLKSENYTSKLFQVADLISTIKLYEVKMKNNELSKSEIAFINSRVFKKTYIKSVNKKEL